MLPDKKQEEQGWDPPLPMILAAWSTPKLFKRLRLEEDIRYAEQHGMLDQVDAHLHGLKPEQWFYG